LGQAHKHLAISLCINPLLSLLHQGENHVVKDKNPRLYNPSQHAHHLQLHERYGQYYSVMIDEKSPPKTEIFFVFGRSIKFLKGKSGAFFKKLLKLVEYIRSFYNSKKN
jgi:hypothetical protein